MLEHRIFGANTSDFILFVFAQKLIWKKRGFGKRKEKKKPALPQQVAQPSPRPSPPTRSRQQRPNSGPAARLPPLPFPLTRWQLGPPLSLANGWDPLRDSAFSFLASHQDRILPPADSIPGTAGFSCLFRETNPYKAPKSTPQVPFRI